MSYEEESKRSDRLEFLGKVLFTAALEGDLGTMKTFIDEMTDGCRILRYLELAIEKGHEELALFLFEKFQGPNFPSWDHWSRYAEEHSQLEVAQTFFTLQCE